MVGVKLDGQSRELLTWALVKVAQTGDRVVALHVLNNNGTIPEPLMHLFIYFNSIQSANWRINNLFFLVLNGSVCKMGVICTEIVDREGKSSLLSLVKAFDSILAVYEGFCNLKQVNCFISLNFSKC